MEERIEISKALYDQLCRKERLLECLEAHGVDNWDGYSAAMGDYLDTEEGDS